jgi:hypothetical protein
VLARLCIPLPVGRSAHANDAPGSPHEASERHALPGLTGAAVAGQHEILDLDLNPITLDLLGAFVHTSNICLNLTATKGPGNLLGNLL